MLEPEPKPEKMEVSEKEKEPRERKVEAQREEVGNVAYKKDFETAIQHYTKVMELDDMDISFLVWLLYTWRWER